MFIDKAKVTLFLQFSTKMMEKYVTMAQNLLVSTTSLGF